jgi:nucleoside-diphosphate-sugar epimerase
MKILITGASGFIGSHLIPHLSQNHEIVTLDSNLLNFDAVEQEVIFHSPDIIVHLAARTEVERSFYEQLSFSEINYTGSINLIESAKKIPNLKNFVFASTMEVYGWQPISDEVKQYGRPKKHVAFDEHTQPNPNAPYAVAKYAVEKYLQYMNRSQDFPFTAIRQTNAYGRSDNDFFVTEQIITQMLKNPESIKLGYKDPYRNFIFISDLLGAWGMIIENWSKVNSGMIFTVGPDNPIQIKDYVNLIGNKIGWSGQVEWDSKPKRPGEIFWLNSNHDLITKTLGWKPNVTLDEGIDRTIEIWKDNIFGKHFNDHKKHFCQEILKIA